MKFTPENFFVIFLVEGRLDTVIIIILLYYYIMVPQFWWGSQQGVIEFAKKKVHVHI